MSQMTIVGGVYREMVMWPTTDEVFGSAGRAACAIAQRGGQVELHAFVDEVANDAMTGLSQAYGFGWHPTAVERGVGFRYTHGLATPKISRWSEVPDSLKIKAERVLRYGMLEDTAIVDADWVVYDPQNARDPESFHSNGSQARHLAVVLNEHEVATILGRNLPADEAILAIRDAERADVVVLKRGPRGAMVLDDSGLHTIPAFETEHVSKIGSGDQFAAQFAYGWMVKGLTPAQAALDASKATAFYCERRAFPTDDDLATYKPVALKLGPRWLNGYRASVYLAGPFFSLSQLWMVEEARIHLGSMGLDVLSPYHDIGQGEADYVVPRDLEAIAACDLVFAIADGLDPGTIYEIGYARALGRPVVVYAENETPENLKMMAGSDCFICTDFVSAVYRSAWLGVAL